MNDHDDKSRQLIWAATYATAFVRGFEARRVYVDFESALEGQAETAITIADAAVEQLDAWIAQEGPQKMGSR